MLGFRAVASALLLMFLASGCNSQLRLPEDLQIYFPQKSTAAFNMAGVKRIFLVSRGKLKDDKVRMATGTVFVSEKELIKVVVKRLVTTNGDPKNAKQVKVAVEAAVGGKPALGVSLDVRITASQHSLRAPQKERAEVVLLPSGEPKEEFNISLVCRGGGLPIVRLSVQIEVSSILSVDEAPQRIEIPALVQRDCGPLNVIKVPATTLPPPRTNPGDDDGLTPTSSGDETSLVQLSAFLAALGLILFMVGAVVLYLCYVRQSKLKKTRVRARFNRTAGSVHMWRGAKKKGGKKSKLSELTSPQDAMSCDVQSQVHTQKSTLSAAPSSAQQNAEGEDGEENDDCDVESQNHAEAAAAAQAIPMNDTQRPASLNSDESMSSVAPLITIHATYPWQYHSVFHGCIIDKDRIQIGQIVKQGSYGQVFEGTLGFPERLPIIVKTSTQSAHVDEIQRLAFEAMVLKGSVHKYVHSVVGICFASTATNGVPVPPFLIFPMVPGQKSLKELLLHTRRVAGIRDSAADAGNGSVGRAAGKMLSTPQLVMMAAQIARGLRHLEKRNIVHKDVATRNCVVLPNLEVRIGDAALSCDLYPNEYHYHFNFGHAKVPLKWMPLECIEQGLFSGNSDVWSFGITMWEIMTLGSLPFEDVDELELAQYLKSGKRLQQPRRCPFELFAIMARCWALSPEDRPGFGFLVHGLYTYADSLRCYI